MRKFIWFLYLFLNVGLSAQQKERIEIYERVYQWGKDYVSFPRLDSREELEVVRVSDGDVVLILRWTSLEEFKESDFFKEFKEIESELPWFVKFRSRSLELHFWHDLPKEAGSYTENPLRHISFLDDRYSTHRGLKMGDSVEEVLELYPVGTPQKPFLYRPYTYSDEGERKRVSYIDIGKSEIFIHFQYGTPYVSLAHDTFGLTINDGKIVKLIFYISSNH